MLRLFGIDQGLLERKLALKQRIEKQLGSNHRANRTKQVITILISKVMQLLEERFAQPDVAYKASRETLHKIAKDELDKFAAKYKKDSKYKRTQENDSTSADLFLNLNEFNRLAFKYVRYTKLEGIEQECLQIREQILSNIKIESKERLAVKYLGEYGILASPGIKVYRNKSTHNFSGASSSSPEKIISQFNHLDIAEVGKNDTEDSRPAFSA